MTFPSASPIKYENAMLQAGGIPVTAPTTTDRAMLAEIVRRVDGVVLTGGDDINPGLYDNICRAPSARPSARRPTAADATGASWF